jgi:hypothetical protein
MVFNFFGLKKEPVVEDVVAKPPSKPEAAPAAKTFEEAYAQQRAVEAAAMTKSEVPVSQIGRAHV